MPRRRYLSSQISTDTRVNRLAEQWGDFAALLYTWMIPHADDAGEITADPEELQLQVIPGRRSKSLEDIEDAVRAMCELGLLVHDEPRGVLRYPPSFARHQSYITKARRESAQNAANQRTSPQNAASSSLEVSSPVEVSSRDSVSPSRAPAQERKSGSLSESENGKVQAFASRLRELGVDHAPTSEDETAIVTAREAPELLADAFAAVFTGRWENDWLRQRLQVRFVVQQIAGYKAALANGFAKNGRTASGDLTREQQQAKYGTDQAEEIRRAEAFLERNSKTKGKQDGAAIHGG